MAGAAGALGATYCSPYLAMDGAYHARPSGQTSSAGMLRLVYIVLVLIILDAVLLSVHHVVCVNTLY